MIWRNMAEKKRVVSSKLGRSDVLNMFAPLDLIANTVGNFVRRRTRRAGGDDVLDEADEVFIQPGAAAPWVQETASVSQVVVPMEFWYNIPQALFAIGRKVAQCRVFQEQSIH